MEVVGEREGDSGGGNTLSHTPSQNCVQKYLAIQANSGNVALDSKVGYKGKQPTSHTDTVRGKKQTLSCSTAAQSLDVTGDKGTQIPTNGLLPTTKTWYYPGG